MTQLKFKNLPQPWRRIARKIYHFGSSRYCPICKSSVRSFLPFGRAKQRPDAACPVCGCLERHRLLWVFLQERTNLFQPVPKKMLHFAPEAGLDRRLQAIPALDYLSADLVDARAMEKIDISAIPYPDGSFDVIYCSHVLEHVPDDLSAMRELRRILNSDGWAALMVPIEGQTTQEDPSIVDPMEREKLFGDREHVRLYGEDFQDRLVEAGFAVERFDADKVVGAENKIRFGVKDRIIFYCQPN